MSLWRDEKYLRLVSAQLDRFTQKSAHNFNFRCPLCGDSERVKSKARGYVYPKNTVLMFKCHNCSVALPFSALLRRLSRGLYNQYMLEGLEDDPRNARRVETSPPAQASSTSEPKDVPRLSPLSECRDPQNPCHRAYTFVANRQVPESQMSRLAATNNAYAWLLPLVGEEKAKKVEDGTLYLVQPLTLPDGAWYGAQLRNIDAKHYTTFRWSHDPLKVFGLDQWNPQQTTYIVEGPIDALFVPNALSACGSDLEGVQRVLTEMRLLPHTTRYVYVWDNEPRNPDVKRHMRNAIRLHEHVTIWPSHYPKDINDMVLSGISIETILETIAQRTFTGLRAELEFSAWQK